jgi:N-acetylglucosaminyldiphosphoundecaprenol N-acetyl-beta-D-mannosaminyltransferase
MPQSVKFMSVKCALSTRREALEAIGAATVDIPVSIATLNPEFMLEAQKNHAFRSALTRMTHCIVDGAGLFMMLKLWGKATPLERYAGSALVSDLFEKYADGSKQFFLLGGPPRLADTAARAIRERYPEISIAGSTDGGHIDAQAPKIDEGLMHEIISAKTDILLVGFGAPKQELWITQAHSVPIMIGVGGTFGFYANKKRAPKWIRALYMEWLYRGLTEKGHWRRVLRAVVVFPLQAAIWITKNK